MTTKCVFTLILFLICFLFTGRIYSQDYAVKSNLLYDASGSMNLGLEFGLNSRMTLDLSVNYNPWAIDKGTNAKIKHILIQPELRFWGCRRFFRHFFGIHTHYGYYNIGSGGNWLVDGFKNMSSLSDGNLSDYRYEGWLAGGGFSYGYHWIMNNRLSFEATIGLGYAYMDYNQYECDTCGDFIEKDSKHYFGPTKIGVSLVYTFQKKRLPNRMRY